MPRSRLSGNVGRNYETGYADHWDLQAVLDCAGTEKLAEALSPPAEQRGPKPYDRQTVVRSLIAMRWLGIPSVSALHRELDNNPALRRACGIIRPGQLPSADTIRRVRRQIADRASLLRELIGEVIWAIKEYLPELGEEVAVDSTVIPAHSNRNNKPVSDPDASSRRGNKAGAKNGFQSVYGFGLTVGADANHDLPLALRVMEGKNDCPELIPLMEDFKSLGLETRVVIADRGYDSKDNSEWLHRRGIAPVIHLRVWGDTHKRKWYPAGFAPDGTPLCECGIVRPYLGTDPDTGERVYGAKPEGCRNLRRANGQRGFPKEGPCLHEVRIDPERDIRLFGGDIRRGSAEWDAKYAKRWSIERIYGRWKQIGRIEDHYLRGRANIETHGLLQMLATLATKRAQLEAEAAEPLGFPSLLSRAA